MHPHCLSCLEVVSDTLIAVCASRSLSTEAEDRRRRSETGSPLICTPLNLSTSVHPSESRTTANSGASRQHRPTGDSVRGQLRGSGSGRPPSPPSSKKDGSWWTTRNGISLQQGSPLLPRQQIIHETKAREKEREKEKKKAGTQKH